MNPLFAEEFRNHLYYYFIIRFFFVFTVVFSFFLFPFVRENTDIFSFSNKVFLTAAFVIVLINIISLLSNRSIKDKYLPLFAYAQFSFEITFWVIVSYLSGGIESPYLYVIIINIVYSGILLREKGAIFTTLFAFMLLLFQGITVKMSMVPLISTELVELYASKWETYFSRLFTYLLFFSFTGFVASRISKGFQQANKDLFESAQKNKELRKHFFAIFSNINMGIIILNRKEIIYINKYAYQFSSILNSLVDIILSDNSAKGRWAEKKIEDMWVSFTVMPYVEEQEVIIFSDVTNIRKREEDLEYQERMAAIGRLTASIAHEIKNPLTSLIGASELMFASIPVPENSRSDSDENQLVAIVRREGKRVKTLLDSLFRYTEDIKPVMVKCNLKPIIEDVATLFKLGHPEIDVDTTVSDVLLFADADRLKEVFWNILINAAESIEGSGIVKISSTVSKDKVAIFIDDSGTGFNEKNIDRIFDPFYSTKKRGTGLGLAQVYRIITKHGGTVKAQNTGAGARIVVELELFKENSNGKE
ncbi:MAG TPA: ATP-binding protein [bacterium]|nr:ATP-binding protein [bacterium]HPS28743.1 ATP-binding protein [bacterium]